MDMNDGGKNVLIVEDEEALLFGLKKLLQSAKLFIDIARSLKEAEDLLRQNRYQAVITDLRLSGAEIIEGYDVVRLARELQPGCKVIVITAYAENGTNYRVAEGAVDHFLEKPVSPARIREILNTL
jgi:DNA-binding NtrC family response regulator